MKFLAVIFDMDGILIDSEPLWERTERTLLSSKGFDYTPSYREKILGLNQEDSAALLKNFFKLNETTEQIINERIEILLGLYEKELDINKPFLKLLILLKEKNISTAVASSSPLRVIDYVLDRFSIRRYFDAVVSGECTKKGKPHPDIYIEAASRLDVPPATCIAIEDSVNGVRSAKSAGMYCIAVPDRRLDLSLFSCADEIVNEASLISDKTAVSELLS